MYGLKRKEDERPIKESTKAMRFRHVRAFFNWCETKALIERNPVGDMDKVSAPKTEQAFLNPEDVKTLLRCIDGHRKTLIGEPGPTPDTTTG